MERTSRRHEFLVARIAFQCSSWPGPMSQLKSLVFSSSVQCLAPCAASYASVFVVESSVSRRRFCCCCKASGAADVGLRFKDICGDVEPVKDEPLEWTLCCWWA